MQPLSIPHSEYSTWKRPTPSCLQLPNNASHPAEHVKSAQGPEALPRQSRAWLAGSMSQAWSWGLIKHHQETRHITWLCLIPFVRLTAAGASYSSLPKNSRSTHVQAKLLALPQDPHTTSDPAPTDTERGEDTWSLSWRCFSLQTWTSRREEKKQRMVKKRTDS